MADPRQKAKDLIELAADENNAEKERMSAAVKACAIIRKYDLLSSPLDMLNDNETVQAVKTIFSVFNDPKVRKSAKRVKDEISNFSRRRSRR